MDTFTLTAVPTGTSCAAGAHEGRDQRRLPCDLRTLLGSTHGNRGRCRHDKENETRDEQKTLRTPGQRPSPTLRRRHLPIPDKRLPGAVPQPLWFRPRFIKEY